MNFAVPTYHRIKQKERKKKDKYLDLEKIIEHEGDNYTNHDRCFWYFHQKIIKRAGGLGYKRTSGYHPNFIFENGQNTEKSSCHSNSSKKPSANSDMKEKI